MRSFSQAKKTLVYMMDIASFLPPTFQYLIDRLSAQKAPDQQSGTIYVTTHRLFFIDARPRHTHKTSFEMDLARVKSTAYYAGLFTSSPKVTVFLAPANEPSASETRSSPVMFPSSLDQDLGETWECEVCGERNLAGRSPSAAQVCTLCGVRRSSMPIPVKQVQLHSQSPPSSSSLPSVIPSPSPSPSPSPALSQSPAPGPSSISRNIACEACTFLNHPYLRECEVCSTPLPQPEVQGSGWTAKSAPTTRAVSPAPPGDGNANGTTTSMIKLSFRKGGDKAFYAELKRSLQRKAWEGKGIGKAKIDTATPGSRSGGIYGIMRTVENTAKDTRQGMSDALLDLETLRVQAKDMVRLAAELNERLTAVSAASTSSDSGTATPSAPSPYTSATLAPSSAAVPEEATFIRSSLSQLGLQMQNAPVTQDMVSDERKWMDELARELADILVGSDDGRHSTKGMMRERGIVALDEVWGGWNRARGVALLPPSTFLSVLPHLPQHTDPPIRARTFPSGLMVLHTPQFTAASFTARLSSLLTLAGAKTTAEIAREEGLTVGLAGEMIGDAEAAGAVCRDEGAPAQGGGVGGVEVQWWPDVFTHYHWDGQDSSDNGS
ncbi:hypothetical protein HWV62_11980 [Athelia sp. TMB]|nr:hypothetical protein HWV62_11980 [Athelia sp. TMB]